jgi:hypothetical protein
METRLIVGYIVETITEDIHEHGMKFWTRHMVGPFPGYDEAHQWMMDVGSKRCATCIIHTVHSHEKGPPS